MTMIDGKGLSQRNRFVLSAILLVVLLGFAAMVAWSYLRRYDPYPTTHEQYLFTERLLAVTQGDKGRIELSEIVDFQWDYFCVYGPYDRRIDVEWRDADGFWTLGFAYKNGSENKHFRIARNIVDFGQTGCFESNSSVRYSKVDGRKRLTIRAAEEN